MHFGSAGCLCIPRRRESRANGPSPAWTPRFAGGRTENFGGYSSLNSISPQFEGQRRQAWGSRDRPSTSRGFRIYAGDPAKNAKRRWIRSTSIAIMRRWSRSLVKESTTRSTRIGVRRSSCAKGCVGLLREDMTGQHTCGLTPWTALKKGRADHAADAMQVLKDLVPDSRVVAQTSDRACCKTRSPPPDRERRQ